MQPEKFSLETQNPREAQLKALLEHLPEAFADGVPNLERFKALLTDEPESRERFGLSWAGKADALRSLAAQVRCAQCVPKA
jgi:hypothetical protein